MEESQKPGIISSAQGLRDGTSASPIAVLDTLQLKKSIDSYLTNSVFQPLLQLLARNDDKAFLVGGAIRDLALGRTPAELDVASALAPEVVQKILESNEIRVIPTGLQHGTVMAVVDGEHCEITTFRTGSDDTKTITESEVDAGIIKDLLARDFTINAIAFSLSSNTVLDPLDGLSAIRDNVLRPCGNPRSRFDEDPLRVLRLIRFGAAQGRTVDQPTLDAAKEYAPRLKNVSAERIQQEFSKLICSDFPRDALEQMRILDIFPVLLPEILPSIEFEQNEFHSEDVYQHTLSVVAASPPDLVVRLAALFHDFGKPHTLTVDEEGRRHFYEHEDVSEVLAKQVLTRWRYSHEVIKNVCLLVAYHMRPLQCGMPGVRRLLRNLDSQFERWKSLKRADHPGALEQRETDAALEAFDAMVAAENARLELDQRRKLVVDGYALMQLGVPAGKKLGLLINYLQELVLDDPDKNEQDILLEESRKWLAATPDT